MKRLSPPLHLALGLAALFAFGSCTILNELEPCEVEPRELRVNQKADRWEFPSTSRAAAALDNGRLLVAYSAFDEDDGSEVRIVMLDPKSGARIALCGEGEVERTLSTPGLVAYGATVVATPFDESRMTSTAPVGAVAWIEGPPNGRQAKVAFLDAAGCPLGPGAFLPGFLVEPPVSAISLAWSRAAQAVVAVYHDGRRVYRSVLPTPETAAAEELASEAWLGADTSIAIDESGRALVAWVTTKDIAALEQRRVLVRALLLDTDGQPLPASLADNRAEPFIIDLTDEFQPTSHAVSVVVAAGDGRFAVAADPAVSAVARPAVHVVELSAEDATPLAEARRVDPNTGEGHSGPDLAYLPSSSLLVAWESTHSGGTLARLFDRELRPRFNSVSCDSERFAVGSRIDDGEARGVPSIVQIGSDVWIVHAGQPSYDSRGTGVVAWSLPFGDLWPAR